VKYLQNNSLQKTYTGIQFTISIPIDGREDCLSTWCPTRDIVRLDGLRQEEPNDFIKNVTHYLAVCSLAPQPTTLPPCPVLACTGFKHHCRGRAAIRHSRLFLSQPIHLPSKIPWIRSLQGSCRQAAEILCRSNPNLLPFQLNLI
jgi:hypothetical protein